MRVAALLNAAGDDPRQRSLAFAEYRTAVMKLLLVLRDDSGTAYPADETKFFHRHKFSEVTPVERSRLRPSGLRRNGLGLPVVGRIAESGVADPNASSSGFVLAATALVLPGSDGRMQLFFSDPTKVETIKAFGQELPLAMDLEAWLDQVEATGPPSVAGFRQMLRPDKFEGRSRLTFLQPFDPDKIPVVLIHGLMSTPRMWKPVLDGLLADGQIRKQYQFWFLYYPTGQPVPFSALQLRQVLTEAAASSEGASTEGIALSSIVAGNCLRDVPSDQKGKAGWLSRVLKRASQLPDRRQPVACNMGSAASSYRRPGIASPGWFDLQPVFLFTLRS